MTPKTSELAAIICGDCGYEIPGRKPASRVRENQDRAPHCTCAPVTRGTVGCGHD
ncbi:MAG: hypothetical protein WCK53_08555 [Methanomicrobiales archaeon]